MKYPDTFLWRFVVCSNKNTGFAGQAGSYCVELYHQGLSTEFPDARMTLVYLAKLAVFASRDQTADFAPEAIGGAFVALTSSVFCICRAELFDLKVGGRSTPIKVAIQKQQQ